MAQPINSVPSADDALPQAVISGESLRLIEEVLKKSKHTSALVSDNIGNLIQNFQALVTIAQEQNSRMNEVIAITTTIRVDHQAITMQEVAETLKKTLQAVIELIISFSKNSIQLVYALDDVVNNLTSVDKIIVDIEKVNRKTNLLALNATIEAVRAGEYGKTFVVVANEVRELASAVRQLAADIREKIGAVAVGIRGGHSMLKDFAALDMNEHIMAKDRLEKIIGAMVMQNEAFSKRLQDSKAAAVQTQNFAGMITNFQFQDRMEQSLAYVNDMLQVMATVHQQLADGSLTITTPDEWRTAIEVAVLALVPEPRRQQNILNFVNNAPHTSWDDIVQPPTAATIELF